MRILLLAHTLPFPLEDGYNLHNFHHTRQLTGRHEIHLAALGGPGGGAVPDAIRGMYHRIHVLPARRPPRPAGPVDRALRALSIHEVYDCDPDVVSGLRGLGPETFDVIWCGGIKMLVYSARLAGAPVLGDIADDETGPARARFLKSRGAVELARNLRDWRRMVRFERAFLRHVAVCTVVGEADRDAVRALHPELDVRVIQNGVDTDYFAAAGEAQEPGLIVFEGNMGFAPNVEGVVHFVDDILPLVRRAAPAARFCAVGRDPAPEVLARRGPRVEITGRVEDVRPFVARGEVFVSPLRSGTGIKNKILQAWSMGKAVVATPESCGGLAVRPGENMVVAAGPEDFAREVVALLGDPARRAALGREGRATVLGGYSWERKSGELEQALSAAARSRQAELRA